MFVNKGTELTDPKQIADGLNNFFTNIGPDLGKPDFMSYMPNQHHLKFQFDYTSAEKIQKTLSQMKCKTSSGEDEITSQFLKNEHIMKAICPTLSILINQSLHKGIFPTRLKLAKVIPLYKDKGEEHLFENYRPISLLSTISKIYERVVFDQLYEFFQSQNLFYESQYGFRKNHITETAGAELAIKVPGGSAEPPLWFSAYRFQTNDYNASQNFSNL